MLVSCLCPTYNRYPKLGFLLEEAVESFLRQDYPPLYYNRDRNSRVSPNKTAVSAIGEAVAGFIAQRLYQCTKLARPNHDYPDVVMEAQRMTYLVEAKGTLQSQEEGIEYIVDGRAIDSRDEHGTAVWYVSKAMQSDANHATEKHANGCSGGSGGSDGRGLQQAEATGYPGAPPGRRSTDARLARHEEETLGRRHPVSRVSKDPWLPGAANV